ncbi:sugar transferase [Sphingomonas abietis]|uniref:Sugar transferase n=1 Tax=Sphingomonas abietis TaxID=3012344 RepID=A0ABY7NHK3_9SPHN|nr:sugar transferase [Sphingomonas abietis]WBO20808.1 sugar transferase [Sphingomonas abietis]
MQILLFGLDIGCLIAAAVIASVAWPGNREFSTTAPIIYAFVLFYVLASLNSGAFGSDGLARRKKGVELAVRSVLIACAGVVLAAFFLKAGEQVSRMMLLIGGMLGSLFIGVERVLFHTAVLHRFGSQVNSEILVVDGCELSSPPGAFVIDAASMGLRCDLSDPLMLDRIGRLLAPADRVVIACPAELRRKWAMVLKGANIDAEIVSPELGEIGPLGTGRFGDHTTVVVAAGPLDLRQRGLKRALDLALAGSALLLLSPLLLLVAIAIKLDSAGAILFVQTRVGRGNRLFGIYKFRSMRSESLDARGHRSTGRDDERITRVGRIIRATSIDELPQLLNILRGEMSFVGPRPHALGSLAGDRLFWEIDERYWHRHACKPGLTGLAQIRGFRGATLLQSDLINRLQSDLEYVTGWTVLRDISILIATLRVVVHRNAY